MILEFLASAVATSLWVSAWLCWVFAGDIRQFLFAKVFPTAWRAGRRPGEILYMNSGDMVTFLAMESTAPGFVTGVLGCPLCLSAYLSAVGTVLSCTAFGVFAGSAARPLESLCLLPLVWAAGAWTGHRLHKHL